MRGVLQTARSGTRHPAGLTAPRSPWQSPYVERLVGSIRRECLDHAIVLGERHVRRILREYVDYHHSCRTHWSLEKDASDRRPIEPRVNGRAIDDPKVGGLHYYYRRLAASARGTEFFRCSLRKDSASASGVSRPGNDRRGILDSSAAALGWERCCSHRHHANLRAGFRRARVLATFRTAGPARDGSQRWQFAARFAAPLTRRALLRCSESRSNSFSSRPK